MVHIRNLMSRRWWLAGLLVLSVGLLAVGCGGSSGSSAAPTGGGSTPVAVELPAIQMPTSIGTDLSGTGAVLNESAQTGLMKAFTGDAQANLVKSSVKDADFAEDLTDAIMAQFEGGTCARAAGTTTCSYSSASGHTMKFDFSKVTSPTTLFSFSHNGTNQDCNLDCLDDNSGTPSSTQSLCMRVWRDGERYLVGKFNVVPVASTSTTSADKGAGCFIAMKGTVQVGIIYDKSNARAALSSGPNSYYEMFGYYSPFLLGSHLFNTETGTSSSSYLINLQNALLSSSNDNTSFASSRFPKDVDLAYGNYKQGTDFSDAPICTTKSGVTATGCSSTGSANSSASDLTTPDLPSYFDLGVSADYTFPSTSVFPASPTF